MVHRLVVNYGQPQDRQAFDDHYRDTHIPLAMKMPGLLQFSIGHAESMDPSAPGPYLTAELDFESAQAMDESFGSTEGRAAAADVANFATGGATMYHYDVREAQAVVSETP